MLKGIQEDHQQIAMTLETLFQRGKESLTINAFGKVAMHVVNQYKAVIGSLVCSVGDEVQHCTWLALEKKTGDSTSSVSLNNQQLIIMISK